MLSSASISSSACATFSQSQTESGSLLEASGGGLRAHCKEKNGHGKVAAFGCFTEVYPIGFMLIMISKLSFLMKEGIRIE